MLTDLNLTKLNYTFYEKPLLVGGKAMEYYQLRKSGDDIDFIISAQDFKNLAEQYPENIKDLFGDMGICIHEFELWRCIILFGYDFLATGAIELEHIKIISLEKLLFLKALGISEKKLENDLRLIVNKIHSIQYGRDSHYPKDYFEQ